MDIMTTGEFASHTGASASQIRALINTGVLPAHEAGGRFLLNLEEVEAEAPEILATLLGDSESDSAEDFDDEGDEDTDDDAEEFVDEDEDDEEAEEY